jgi:hypothetical protein
MVFNEALNTIVDDVLHRQLGKAIAHLENYLYTFVQPQAQEQLQQIKSDYQLMTGYWQQGYDDPDREVVYDPQKRIGVMRSTLGASKAISLGAYAFALGELDK